MDLVKKERTLFARERKEIGVYSLIPQKEALIEYRKKIMQGQNQDQLVLDMISTDHIDFRVFEDSKEIPLAAYEKQFKLRYCRADDKKISQYVNGDFSHSIPIRMISPNYKYIRSGVEDVNIHSVLVSDKDNIRPDYIHHRDCEHYYEINNAIKLPLELWLLQLIETGLFGILIKSGYNFDEQIAMFEAKQIDSLSNEQLKRFYELGFATDDYETLTRRIETTQKVLKRCLVRK